VGDIIMSEGSVGFLDYPPQKNCYATLWSYGEICVGCGCCSKDITIRRPARLKYWQWWLEEQLHFKHWCEDPELRKIQEINVRCNLKEAKRRVRYYNGH
jgi:hypothetical protein